MQQNNREVGEKYEQIAAAYLQSLGYKILEYNYRCPMGEIDLIAQDGEYLVFCEVKYRKTKSKGTALEAVGRQKQRTICRCALHYMVRMGQMEAPIRFDVIGFEGEERIHIQDAFQNR